MTHPLSTILQNGVAVSKTDLLAYLEKSFEADDAAQVANTDLPTTLVITCPVSTGKDVFFYDQTDTTSVQDVSAGILRSRDGRVFKSNVLDASQIQTFVLAAIIAAGGIGSSHVASGTANTVLGRDAFGDGAELGIADIVALLDAFIQSSDWRTSAIESDVSKIAKFPENKWSGGRTFYVLMADGRVRACGSGTNFANGNESSLDNNRLLAIGVVGGSPVFSKIWSGGLNCWALAEDGTLWAMGQNDQGQLGLGDTTDRSAFNEVDYFRINGLTIVDVIPIPDTDAYGASEVLVRCTDGRVYHAGSNDNGQAGDGTTDQNNTFKPWGEAYTPGGVTLIDGVFVSPRAVYVTRTDGSIIACGYDFYGSMALGASLSTRLSPVLLTAVSNAAKIVTDDFTTLYLLDDGTLVAAGLGSEGQRGDGSFAVNTTPAYGTVTVALGGDCLDIAMQNASQTFAMAAAIVETAPGERTLKLWGYNGRGTAGDGTNSDVASPYAPTDSWNGSVDQVFFGGSDSFVSIYVRVGNDIYSCGYNGRANLVRPGTGISAPNLFGPVAGIFGTIEDIHIGGDDSFGILRVLTDKTALAGGQNNEGALGIDGVAAVNYHTLQDMLSADAKGPNPVASPPVFTVATLPASTAYPVGTAIYVTDETGGPVGARTDGTNWRRETDRAVVS